MKELRKYQHRQYTHGQIPRQVFQGHLNRSSVAQQVDWLYQLTTYLDYPIPVISQEINFHHTAIFKVQNDQSGHVYLMRQKNHRGSNPDNFHYSMNLANVEEGEGKGLKIHPWNHKELLFDRIHLLFADNDLEGSNEFKKSVTEAQFCSFWKAEMEPFDYLDRLFRLLKQPDNNYIFRGDFEPLINELLTYHPGLGFLQDHPDFHPKYIITVITRIFYAVNRSWNGCISRKELRKSNLMEVFHLVDEEEDINKIMHYFNYEHFYVIFCQFYELDTERKYTLNRDQLLRHGEHGLSSIIVNRIFDVGPRPFVEPGSRRDVNYISYEDYIYFLLSEEDKGNEHSLKYWFTCCDVDGDGKLTHMDMKLFYDVQMLRMENLGHEIIPYSDMMYQMWDMLQMEDVAREYILLEDLLRPSVIKVAGNLFDALFNLYKFIGAEQRDPILESAKRTDQFRTAWDRYSWNAYHHLAAEDEETDDGFTNEWECDSCQFQYSEGETEGELDEDITEDEDSDLNWY